MKLVDQGFDEQGFYRILQDDLGKRWRAREPDFCKHKPMQLRMLLEDAFYSNGRPRRAYHLKGRVSPTKVVGE